MFSGGFGGESSTSGGRGQAVHALHQFRKLPSASATGREDDEKPLRPVRAAPGANLVEHCAKLVKANRGHALSLSVGLKWMPDSGRLCRRAVTGASFSGWKQTRFFRPTPNGHRHSAGRNSDVAGGAENRAEGSGVAVTVAVALALLRAALDSGFVVVPSATERLLAFVPTVDRLFEQALRFADRHGLSSPIAARTSRRRDVISSRAFSRSGLSGMIVDMASAN